MNFSVIPESIQGGFNHSEWMYHLETDLMSIWAPLMYNDTYDEFLHAIEYNYSPWPYIEDEYANRDAYNKVRTPSFNTFFTIQCTIRNTEIIIVLCLVSRYALLHLSDTRLSLSSLASHSQKLVIDLSLFVCDTEEEHLGYLKI